MRFSVALLMLALWSCDGKKAAGGDSGADVASIPDVADVAEAGAADASANESAKVDAVPEVATPEPNPRCAGGTYTTAPSGAACDPMRILQAKGLAGWCYGPPIGASCTSISLELTSSEATPPGFECGLPRMDVRVCNWKFDGDASSGMIDSAVLESLCAVTAAISARAITCINFGS